jgi:hypothetical protein
VPAWRPSMSVAAVVAISGDRAGTAYGSFGCADRGCVVRDQLDQSRAHFGREVVSHPLDCLEPSPGYGGRGGSAAGRVNHQVVVAMDDQCRGADAPELAGAVSGGDDGRELPEGSGGPVPAIEAAQGQLPGCGPRRTDSRGSRCGGRSSPRPQRRPRDRLPAGAASADTSTTRVARCGAVRSSTLSRTASAARATTTARAASAATGAGAVPGDTRWSDALAQSKNQRAGSSTPRRAAARVVWSDSG